jgi:PAS domain-containing protein
MILGVEGVEPPAWWRSPQTPFLPIASLVADANGLILEANQAVAQWLNVPQRYLAGKPLVLCVAEGDRSAFRTQLNQLSQCIGTY